MEVLDSYEKILQNIPLIIEKSGLKDSYIAEKVGIRQGNFSVKKQRNNWKFEEVKKIIETVLNPSEDVEDFLLGLEMEARKNEEEISYEEFKRLTNATDI